MSERLTLQDLIDLLSQRQDITKKDAETFLRELIALISETVEQNEPVRIKDFGTFKLVKVNVRKSVNVNTGEEIEIAAHYKLTFTPDKSLRDSINKPFAHFESVVIEDGVDFENMKVTAFGADEEAESEDLLGEDPDLTATEESELLQQQPETENPEIDLVEEESETTIVETVVESEPDVETREVNTPNEVEEEERPPLDEDVDETFEEPTNKVGSAVEEMSASMEAFRNNNSITEEDNKILASLTLNQSEYRAISGSETDSEDKDIIDATELAEQTVIMSEEEKIRAEEEEKAARLEETINRLLAKSKVREVASLSIEKITEPKESEQQTMVSEETIVRPSESRIVATQSEDVEVSTTVGSNSPSAEQHVVEQSTDQTAKDNNATETKPEDQTPTERVVPPPPVSRYAPNYEEEEDDEYDDDDMYEYDNGNKKTYIYLGVALVVIIGAILFMKFYPRATTPTEVVNEIVVDSLDQQIKDSIAKSDTIEEAIDPTLTAETSKDKVEDKKATAAVAATTKPSEAPKQNTANAGKKNLGTETLEKGQTLRLISLKYYGHKSFWVYIYQVNKGKIKDPNNVSVGTKLVIPSLDQFNVNPKVQKDIDKAKRMEGEILRGASR